MKTVTQFIFFDETRYYIFIYDIIETSRYLDWSDSRTGFEEVARSPAALAKTNLAPFHPACDKHEVKEANGMGTCNRERLQTWEQYCNIPIVL